MVNLGQLLNRYDKWMANLPQVQPFYAVKCNDDPAILKTLAALGCGFDCASKVIQQMQNVYHTISSHVVV